MHYVWEFAILAKYSHLFWLGLGFTILYTVGTVFLGTLIGLVVNLVLTTAFAVAFVQSIVNDRRDMQTKLAVQAWQLGQLISADE